jgi:hypothetical protein
MKILQTLAIILISTLIFSCKKKENKLDVKCLCVQYENQKCLKYYQTVQTDPWGSSMQSDRKIEKGVKHFCDSLGVKTLYIKITNKKFNDYTQCECSKTGKIICVKVNENDAPKLKKHNFIDN